MIERFQAETGDRVSRGTAAIGARLRQLVTEAEAERWLPAPNSLLDGASPKDVIARGETDRVSETLLRFEEGIYV